MVLTLVGFAIGVLTCTFSGAGLVSGALVVIFVEQAADGLDGALARCRGLTDAGGFVIFLSIFFFTRWYLWVYPRRTAAKRLAGGWLLFAFIGTGSSFSLLLRWRRNIRLIIPVMRINRFIIRAG